MKCSKTNCNNDAVGLIPIYNNKNQIIAQIARCREHAQIERKELRFIKKIYG